MRLNLGSGQYPLKGWVNIDAYVNADVEGDIRSLDYRDVTAVNMSHVLEHIPWRDVPPLLERIHGWMIPAGVLTIEVPDMEAITALGTVHPLWFKYVYGDQSHPGEFHLSGWTAVQLRVVLADAGWREVRVRRFESGHKGREGMPCLEAMALA
jgi:predicted SAM-dependent methyltransferase